MSQTVEDYWYQGVERELQDILDARHIFRNSSFVYFCVLFFLKLKQKVQLFTSKTKSFQMPKLVECL